MLLNGTAEMFQASPTDSTTPKKPRASSTKRREHVASGQRERIPEPGEGLLSNSYDTLHGFNKPQPSKVGESSDNTSAKNTVIEVNDTSITSSTSSFKAGAHFAKLQQQIDQRNKPNMQQRNPEQSSSISTIQISDSR